MKSTKKTMILAGSLLAAAMMLPASSSHASTPTKPMLEKIRKELVTLPFYNVFDNLGFSVNANGEVTIFGNVTRPTLRSSAENVVKKVEGVTAVHNKIEVLPLSPFDDRLRLALFRAIYSTPGLDRYALGAIPGIHIIVNNGNVKLEGVVAREMEKNMAFIRANGVPGVFSVENNLIVAGK
ncbi:MAG: BON domain-containing protein [Bryobacterales bacterium]|nr:BON domain-containing protein [Bryobacterales bacterium]